jgi:hypothetical protein
MSGGVIMICVKYCMDRCMKSFLVSSAGEGVF